MRLDVGESRPQRTIIFLPSFEGGYCAFRYAMTSLIWASVRMEPKAGMGGKPFLIVSVACAGVIGGVTSGFLPKIPCKFGGPNGVVSPGCLLWQLAQFC